MNILITGSEGFIGQYLVKEALKQGHAVTGIDNLSKYGKVSRLAQSLSGLKSDYILVRADLTKADQLYELLELFEIDHLIMNAAVIGGIAFFHEHAYKIISENEQILKTSFDAAINYERLQKITVISSSMIYESATEFPLKEDMIYEIPPPKSTYGFQKLAAHYFCKGAYEEHNLPYTIIIPFNAIGIGEHDFSTGNSHVIPDLIYKLLTLKSGEPLQLFGSGKQIRY